MKQAQVGNLERDFGWIALSLVDEHDDRKPLTRKALEHCSEANRFAVMPYGRLAAICAGKPPKTIACILIGKHDARCESLAERFQADQPRGVERLIPLEQIIYRGIDAAIPQDRTGEALVGSLKLAIPLRVAIGAIANGRDSGRMRPCRPSGVAQRCAFAGTQQRTCRIHVPR